MTLSSTIKRNLRPVVYHLRRFGYGLGRRLRPPIPWDGRHHPALTRFPPWQGRANGVFHYDFLGVRTHPEFQPGLRAQPAGPLATEYPHPFPSYFELIFVLDSVASRDPDSPFTMLELGAGYGRWLVVAACARRQVSASTVRLVGVEMVPQHREWMRRHMRNNGIDPADHLLIHAAVTDVDGEAWFEPEVDPAHRYGQSMEGRTGESGATGPTPPRGGVGVRVPARGLESLLREIGEVDLVHVDIQGEERRALPRAIGELSRRVRRLVVETHSTRIHGGLRRTLVDAGWTLRHDYRYGKRQRTPFGDVHFVGGHIAAVNPALDDGDPPASG